VTDRPVRALVGWSGFVGGNLLSRTRPQVRVRRDDVERLAEQHVDEIICAGAPAEKWRANADPDGDLTSIRRLLAALDSSTARSCILVSTVDVYADSVGADETRPPDRDQPSAYGRHRAMLEDFVRERFAEALLLRLPGLFGPGLKKNLVFDLLHQPRERFAHSDSTFQFYDVRDLWGHVLQARDAGLSLVHLATEPVSAADVAKEAFGIDYLCQDRPRVDYDLRTRHAADLAGRDGPYIRTRGEVLASIRDWAAGERARRG
jgi:nucleoside-diphosphate-sugar epimerase